MGYNRAIRSCIAAPTPPTAAGSDACASVETPRSSLTMSWLNCNHDLAGVERLGITVGGAALHAAQPHQGHERVFRKPVLVTLSAEHRAQVFHFPRACGPRQGH